MALGLKTLIDSIRINGHIQELTVHDLNEILEQGNQSSVVIDVRETAEWELSHVPNAIHLSKGIIEVKIEQLIPDKNTTLVLYCGGGTRSLIAADSLSKMGYKNCISILGGFREWQQLFPVSH